MEQFLKSLSIKELSKWIKNFNSLAQVNKDSYISF
jgi:hypothetical protein